MIFRDVGANLAHTHKVCAARKGLRPELQMTPEMMAEGGGVSELGSPGLAPPMCG